MQRRRIRKDREGLGFITTLLILVVVFAVILGVYTNLVAYNPPSSVAQATIVELNDTVRVSYIGYFEDNHVFDTSIKSVADDNSTWPKALSFNWRSSYSDYSFTTGKTDCSSGATDCAIIGMSKAVFGLQRGDSVTHTIPPDDGYGQKNPSLVSTRSVVEPVPVRQVMNASTFKTSFGSDPQDGTVVKDPKWGWPVLVHVSGGLVTVENSPEISKSYDLYVNQTKGGSWSITVEGIDDGANNGTGVITIRDRFAFTQGNKLQVTVTSTGSQFFVTDNGDGTYTVDSNREVVGVNLVFYITILQITKSA